MQAQAFNEGMKLLSLYFGPMSDRVSEADEDKLTALYWRGLSDLHDGAFALAVDEAVKRCRFWPKVAELREFAAPYRIPKRLQQQSGAVQIEEFSVCTQEQAKEAIARIAAGLDERFDDPVPLRLRVVPGREERVLPAAEFERRRQRLQEQAQRLAEVA